MRILLCLILTFLFVNCSHAAPEKEISTIKLRVQDHVPFHVHQNPAYPIKIAAFGPKNTFVSYQWHDFQGNALTQTKTIITGQTYQITLPSSLVGYYGLRFSNDGSYPFDGKIVGETREYGFVVATPPQKQSNKSPFGTIHSDVQDPYMPPWVKTVTWLTAPPYKWQRALKYIANHNKVELPIIFGNEWASNDDEILSQDSLDKLFDKARAYFRASPSTAYWEAGLEENLKENYTKKHYWDNLEKKFVALQDAAQAAKAKTQFIYQMVGIYSQGIEDFFKNKAYRYVDVISLHPYAWPNFSSPDTWLEPLLSDLAALQNKHGTQLPVWFTEVGAPHFGNYSNGFFGYPKDNRVTGGLSKTEAVSFLTKLCVMARSLGVEKVFWYNYQDRSPAREEVESHFGLRDFWGHPKPVYAAYSYITKTLGDTKGHRIKNLPEHIRAYRFRKSRGNITVIWSAKEDSEDISLSKLGLQRVHITEPTGRPRAMTHADSITIGASPIFIHASNRDVL